MEYGKELIVSGYEDKENRLYYHCPPKPTGHVVYFPGDIQDIQSVMEAQYHDINQWAGWSIEKTCQLLKEKYPTSAIWMIRPHTLLRHLFSCYHNFVESSVVGVPTYSSEQEPKAIPHLSHLLYNATHTLYDSAQLTDHTSFYHLPLTLIGFSKGCVVLNQIIHELGHYLESGPPSSTLTKDGENLKDFVLRIKAMYLLDSGHSGESGVWVTDKEILKYLAVFNPEVHVHVTSHQMCHPQRMWIPDEECQFISHLKELGLTTVNETYHFRDEPRSLLNHFRILNIF